MAIYGGSRVSYISDVNVLVTDHPEVCITIKQPVYNLITMVITNIIRLLQEAPSNHIHTEVINQLQCLDIQDVDIQMKIAHIVSTLEDSSLKIIQHANSSSEF